MLLFGALRVGMLGGVRTSLLLSRAVLMPGPRAFCMLLCIACAASLDLFASAFLAAIALALLAAVLLPPVLLTGRGAGGGRCGCSVALAAALPLRLLAPLLVPPPMRVLLVTSRLLLGMVLEPLLQVLQTTPPCPLPIHMSSSPPLWLPCPGLPSTFRTSCSSPWVVSPILLIWRWWKNPECLQHSSLFSFSPLSSSPFSGKSPRAGSPACFGWMQEHLHLRRINRTLLLGSVSRVLNLPRLVVVVVGIGAGMPAAGVLLAVAAGLLPAGIEMPYVAVPPGIVLPALHILCLPRPAAVGSGSNVRIGSQKVISPWMVEMVIALGGGHGSIGSNQLGPQSWGGGTGRCLWSSVAPSTGRGRVWPVPVTAGALPSAVRGPLI